MFNCTGTVKSAKVGETRERGDSGTGLVSLKKERVNQNDHSALALVDSSFFLFAATYSG